MCVCVCLLFTVIQFFGNEVDMRGKREKGLSLAPPQDHPRGPNRQSLPIHVHSSTICIGARLPPA